MKPSYRPDIDGLRAVAVLSVIFFHAGVKTVAGGFIGVDIFFVISGYLITTIITKEIENNEFSIAKFYERRIRRIFPALFFVITLTLVSGALLFDSTGFENLGKATIATTYFISNILFWSQSGYFDAPSEHNPLLHAWSLAVEEQYYIFFPLLLIFLARNFNAKYTPPLLILIFSSLAISIYTVTHDPNSAFYLIHSRTWELLLGSIVALKIIPPPSDRRATNSLYLSGLILIGLSVFLYSSETAFPGLAAIPPCVGAALIIYSGTNEMPLAGKALSSRPIVFIGLISYSLYLWHWPFIVFYKYYAIRDLDTKEITILLFAILTLSVFSWKYIEKPFRSRRLVKSRKIVFGQASCIMLVAISSGSYIYLNNGIPYRFEPDKTINLKTSDISFPKQRNCTKQYIKNGFPFELCEIGTRNQKPAFLLWGDSHAHALIPAISSSAMKYGATGVVATKNACPPLLGIERQNRLTCAHFNNALISYLQKHPEIRTVFLAARWALSAEGTRYKSEKGPRVTLRDIQSKDSENTRNESLFETGLKRTIKKLAQMNRDTILISQVPEAGHDIPSAYSISNRTSRNINEIIPLTAQEYFARNHSVLSVFNSLEKLNNIKIIDPWKILCGEKLCSLVKDGRPLYMDDDHLSTWGALYVSPIFYPIFSNPHTERYNAR
jgi:peptidoglycan/LPS O-acetylase OafA/YrhL